MKQTFIFKVDDQVCEDDLYRLAGVADRSHVSWKGEMTGRYYISVQVFTDPTTMHHIAHRAGFSGEQLRLAIPAARERGSEAITKASNALRNRTLDAIDKKRAEEKRAMHGIRYSSKRST